MNHVGHAFLGVIWLSLLSPLVQAGDGHDHGDAPVAQTTPALPRLAITGQQFELVGELSPTQLTLYIDWLATTAPAAGAQVTLQLNDDTLSTVESAPGTFVASLAATESAGEDHDHETGAGEQALVATIALDQAKEQLSGHFEHTAADHAEPPQDHDGLWLAAGTALLAALGLGLGLWRRRAHGGGQ